MSDLVKNLRNPDWVGLWFDQAGFQAADRIEALEAERDRLREALRKIYRRQDRLETYDPAVNAIARIALNAEGDG